MNGDLRINLTRAQAEAVLDRLPGGPELYKHLADVFLAALNGPPADDGPGWPAMSYVYGTWAYALERAREHATERNQRVWLYRAEVNGELQWIVAWDPKPRHCVVCIDERVYGKIRAAERRTLGGRYCVEHAAWSRNGLPCSKRVDR